MQPLFLKDTVSTEQREAYQELIQYPIHKNADYDQELTRRLKEYFPALNTLFDSANSDGISTIEEHSLKVMELFDDQARFYEVSLQNLRSKHQMSFRNLTGLVKTIIALHDIGKPFGRGDQHRNTDPIVAHALRELGFDFAEIQFARAFLETDLLGEMIMDSDDKDLGSVVETAYSELVRQAGRADVPVREFHQLLCNFYIADSNFYPSIARHFQDEPVTGRRVPKEEKSLSAWKELEARVLKLN